MKLVTFFKMIYVTFFKMINVTGFKMKGVTKTKKKKEALDQMSIFDVEGVSGAVGHGGKRAGSGRKKKEETIVMRVPKSLEAQIKQLIEDHKKGA